MSALGGGDGYNCLHARSPFAGAEGWGEYVMTFRGVQKSAAWTRTALMAILVAATTAVPASVGRAEPPVDCPPGSTRCEVEAGRPGSPGRPGDPGGDGGGGGGGTGRVCTLENHDGLEIPCYREDFGWWHAPDQCYYKLMEPQPTAETTPGLPEMPNRRAYVVRCANAGSPSEWDYGWTWLEQTPSEMPSPAELAERAVDSMALLGPDIRTSVGAGGMALVGVPVWFWTTTGPRHWGPNTATASVTGLTVTATARAEKIVWDLGDGRSVTCHGPGTPYESGSGRISSPTCGHLYQRSSAAQPRHAYPIRASTTWRITWQGGGTSGVLTQVRTSTAELAVGELQVLVSR